MRFPKGTRTMRRTRSQVVLLILVLAHASLLQAQVPTLGSAPPLGIVDLSGFGRTPLLDKAQTRVADAKPSSTLEVVVHFLQLRPDQVEGLRQLLQARQEAVSPLVKGLVEREQRLRELLEAGGTPSEVGQVVIEIHFLQGQLMQVQQDFLTQWENLLDAEQRQRLEAVRWAARLQSVVPAFHQLQLL
jgi:hypothetical protein